MKNILRQLFFVISDFIATQTYHNRNVPMIVDAMVYWEARRRENLAALGGHASGNFEVTAGVEISVLQALWTP